MIKQRLILLLIIIFAITLRFIGLESLSPPLNRDEAGIGVNAYYLLETGKDEHDQLWPLSFKSIGDYKMPGYIYLSMLPIKVFGLNVFSVRFGSALAGVLAVLAIWYLTKYLSTDNKLPIIASLLMAINPWHLHFSRIGFEANVNLTLFLWAIVFFVWGIKKRWLWMITAILLVAMQFMYSSTFVFLPMFIMFSIVLWIILQFKKHHLQFLNYKYSKILIQKINLPIILAVSMLILGSIFAVFGVMQVSHAKQSITIFGDDYILDNFNKEYSQVFTINPILAKLWMNKLFYLSRIVFFNYLKSFSPSFLLFSGTSHPWHGVYHHGYFYLLSVPFFFLGLIQLIKQVFNVEQKAHYISLMSIFILSMLISAPIASAITIDAPHATRSLYLIPAIIIIISLGVIYTASLFKIKYFYPILFVGYLISFIVFIYQYIVVYPKHYDLSFYPNISQVYKYLNTLDQNKPIYSDGLSSSAYLYLLFYKQIDPKLVQQTAIWSKPDTVGLTHIQDIGKYHFVPVIPRIEGSGYWVTQGKDAPPGFLLKHEIIGDRSGKIEWRIFEKN